MKEEITAVKAIAHLADVIPPDLLPKVLEHLFTLLEGPQNGHQQERMRQQALRALKQLVPQLNAEQTSRVIQLGLAHLAQPQAWILIEESLELLNECFIQATCNVDTALYAPVAEAVLGFQGDDHMRRHAEKVATHVARTAPLEIRQQVVSRLRAHPEDAEHLELLAFLNEPILLEQLTAEIDRILRSVNPKPEVTTDDGQQAIAIGLGAINARALKNFHEVLPDSLNERVVNGLLEAIINEHGTLATRSDAIWTLSELPEAVLRERADEITDYLLWGAEGTLPRSRHVEWQLQSQKDPFSRFREDMGNVEDIRQSSLRSLGCLYARVGTSNQEKIVLQLVNASRDSSSIVRQGVAMALSQMEGDGASQVPLLLALVALLHDDDPGPCSWASSATGHLVARGATIRRIFG